jgi:hypothetical protein
VTAVLATSSPSSDRQILAGDVMKNGAGSSLARISGTS